MDTKNLENMVEGAGLLRRIGSAVKRYATIAMAAAALTAGTGYVSGCGEQSECCDKLSCGGDSYCDDVDPSKGGYDKCVESYGEKECCICKDMPNY